MKRAALPGALLLTFLAARAGARPLRVDLDSRLELAGAVERLAAPNPASSPDPLAGCPYVRALTGRLPAPPDGPLRSSRPQWTAADRARVMLSLSPLPALERLDLVEFSDAERAGGAQALEAWLKALREYARVSGFGAAFNASRYLLDPAAARLRRRLAAAAPLEKFAAYTGLPQTGRTRLLLSPFQAAGASQGYERILDDGNVSLTVILGPEPSTPASSGLDFWWDGLPASLWNELAQSRLDPLAELYAGRIAQSSGLAAKPGWSCARDWRRCVEDQIARAVTLRLVARRDGAVAEQAQREGFEGDVPSPMLTALLMSLERYEKARPGGERLADYYPRLLSALPLDDPNASPAPPALPPASSLLPAQRRRLAAFLKAIAPGARDARLRALASASRSWAAAAAPAADAELAAPRLSTAAADAASLRSEGLEDYKAGRTDAALADFQAALSTAPGDAQTLMSEAAVLADLGRDDDALAAYASALESARAAADGPALLLAADVLSSRATLLARRGRAAEAASDLEDALRTAPPEWPRRADARRRLKALTRRSRRAP